MNRLVEDRLAAFAKARQAMGRWAKRPAGREHGQRTAAASRHPASESRLSRSSAIIRVAAELAHLLGLALHGVFLEEEALPELAALPFIREFRLATRDWRKLDAERIAEEQRCRGSRGAAFGR